jgi:hypothetical protein
LTVFLASYFRNLRFNTELMNRAHVTTPDARHLPRDVAVFKFFTAKTIAAVVAAAIVAGFVVSATSIVPEAKAEAPIAAPVQALPSIKTVACSPQPWPYYAQGCDLRGQAGETRTVRIIPIR